MLDPIKNNWRILLLVVVVIGASVALFAPQFAPQPAEGQDQADARQGITNLQYGLEPAGGTRIRAPLIGYVAEDVRFGGDDPTTVADNVATQLPDTTVTDVNAEWRGEDDEGTYGDVEVTDADVSESEFREALDAAGYEYGSVDAGVMPETREATVNVIESKINEAGLSGGSVREVFSTGAGQHFVLVEVPGEGRQDVLDLLSERGTVRIDIFIPSGGEDGEDRVNQAVLTQEDFENIGTAQRDGQEAYVPVSVVNTDGQPAAERLQDAVAEADSEAGGGTQGWNCAREGYEQSSDPCLLLVVDDEVVNSFGMQPGLRDSMVQGSWATDPSFRLTLGTAEDSFQRAQQVSINLRAGALPAELDIGPGGSGTSSFISPSQGDDFRIYSAITGVMAVFAVAGMVFLRYREKEVALPMIVTALAEVYALLGFAALVGYPVDLAVIAGFIAVVGTGVDDLVIIADEVMSEGEVKSRKVFDSRFRRAFWVIGAAAATTILAMSPLMILSLGDLSGFAIFTILGVLIGVLVTRPAYGDILRRLLTIR